MARRGSGLAVACSLSLVVLVTACSGAVGPQGGPESQVSAGGPRTSGPRWPTPVRVDHQVVSVGFGPQRLTVAGGAVWAASRIGTVYRVDSSGGGRRVVELGTPLGVATVMAGRLFVGDNRGGRVLVYDPDSGARTATVPMPGPVRAVLAALGSVWVTAGDAVVRLDPVSLRRRSLTRVGGEVAQLAVAGDAVVVTNRTAPEVTRLDQAGRVVGTADVGGPTIGVAVSGPRTWVLRTDAPKAVVVSSERFAPAYDVDLPDVSLAAAPVGDEVWVTLFDEGTIARLSAAGKVVGQVATGRGPFGIVSDGEDVWIGNERESTLWRLSADLATVGT